MIDKLGLDGLGGASVRVEPTPQGTNGVTGKADAGPVVVGLEPVAFMTHHDDPMVFPAWDEAVQYCDDDESPISLFHAADVAKLQADLATMTKKADGFFDALQLAAKINAEGQAREKQLREALEICQAGMPGDKWDSLYIDGVLAFPQDDTALNTLLAAGQAREQQLREALELVKRDARHYIPHYAFGDNEAACEMNRLLENIEGYGDEALALPQDDTALRQWGAKLLRDLADKGWPAWDADDLRLKADELEAGK